MSTYKIAHIFAAILAIAGLVYQIYCLNIGCGKGQLGFMLVMASLLISIVTQLFFERSKGKASSN